MNPSRRPRLLFVVNADWFFVSHRLPIAIAAQQRGYEVHVATTISTFGDRFSELGFHVHPVLFQRGSFSPRNGWRMVCSLSRVFREVRPDVVHLVTVQPVAFGGLAARLARVPAVVAAVPGLGFIFVAQGLKAKLLRRMVGLLYRVALQHRHLRVIFQNDSDARLISKFAGIRRHSIVMMPGSGVDLNRFVATPRPTSPPIVLMAARLLVDKGVREFIQAAQDIQRHHAIGGSVRFVIVGSIDPGNPASLTEEEVAMLTAEGDVEFWGQRSDMPEVLAAASIVVLPSYREGMPKVLLEAAACARAVITTDVPGCRDAIIRGETGLLVPARDAEALASAIVKLLARNDEVDRMGMAGRVLAETRFDVREVVDRHCRLYDELCLEIGPNGEGRG